MKQKTTLVLARLALLTLIMSVAGLFPIFLLPSPASAAPTGDSSEAVSAPDSEKNDDTSVVSDEESKEEKSEQAGPKKGIGTEELSLASSVTQAIQGQEGVTVQTMCTNCNEANLSVGGLGDEHVNISMDGFRLFGGLPRIFALSLLPAPGISKIDVSSGPGYAENYYEAIGGTLSLTSHKALSRPTIQPSLEKGSYGWSREALYADWKIGLFSGKAAGTKSHFDPIDANSDGHVETGETDQWTGYLDLALDFEHIGNFSFGGKKIRDEQIDGHGRVGYVDIDTPTLTYLNEDTYVDWQDYHFGYDLLLPKGHTIQLRAIKYDRDQKIKSPDLYSIGDPDSWQYLIEETNTYGDIKYQGIIGTRWILSAGFNSEDDENTVSGKSMPPDRPVLEESVKGWGAFSQASVDIMPELSLTFGTRYDKFDIFGDAWSPRTVITWKPIRSISVLTSYGYGFRPPRPIFNEICCGQSPESNNDVLPETSKNASISFIYQPSPAWKFSTFLHRNDFEDYIIKMVGGSMQFHQKLMNGNIKDATIQGFDTSLSWKWSKGLSVSGSFSWVDAQNNDNFITLYPHVFAPVDLIWPVTLPMTDIPYIAERSGQLALSFTPPNNLFTVNVQTQYTGSMLIQHYFWMDDIFMPPPAGLYEDYVSTPDFWVVNLSGKIYIKKHFEVRFGIDNINDYVQEDLGDFSRDYNWGPIRGRYYYGGVSYIY